MQSQIQENPSHEQSTGKPNGLQGKTEETEMFDKLETFYIVNKNPTEYSGSSPQMSGFLSNIASSKWIGTQLSNTFFAYDMEIAIAGDFGDVTAYKRSPNIIQKGNSISYYGKDGQEVTILASNFGTFESDTVSEIQGF